MELDSRPVDLARRTKAFALRVIRLCAVLPANGVGGVIGRQLLRSATSVGAHYREALRSRSTPEYVSKIYIGLQELEESVYWMELLGESGTIVEQRLMPLMNEARELTAILFACARTARRAP